MIQFLRKKLKQYVQYCYSGKSKPFLRLDVHVNEKLVNGYLFEKDGSLRVTDFS